MIPFYTSVRGAGHQIGSLRHGVQAQPDSEGDSPDGGRPKVRYSAGVAGPGHSTSLSSIFGDRVDQVLSDKPRVPRAKVQQQADFGYPGAVLRMAESCNPLSQMDLCDKDSPIPHGRRFALAASLSRSAALCRPGSRCG